MPSKGRVTSSVEFAYRKFRESCKRSHSKFPSVHAHSSCRRYSKRQRYQMASINPGRTSAYSDDLRSRMVWQKETLGATWGVNSSTVSRVVSLFNVTGSVQKRPYPEDARPYKKLSKTVQLTVLHTVLQHPGIYLCELETEVTILTGVDASVFSLCTLLHKSNFTHQRMRIVAKEQDRELHEQFAIDVSLYKPHMLVIVD